MEKEHETNTEYVLFGPENLPNSMGRKSGIHAANEVAPTHSGPRAHLWEQFSLPRILPHYDLDVFHTPAGQPPVVSRVPQVVTIHDISPIMHPEWFSRPYAALYRILTPFAVRSAERIITVSQSSREDIVSRYPSASGKTVAIYNGVAPRKANDGTPVAELPEKGYILFVGSNNPRKNLPGVLRAYRRYRQHSKTPLPLALAGPNKDLFRSERLPEVDGMLTLGYVSEPQLTWLYHNARALVFPSLYEGFGLPILEAMSAGTPVITSDRGAMAEVAGDAAHLVDPTDPDDIAHGIQRVLDDREYATTLAESGRERAAEFTWERTARETLQVYREVANL